MKGFRDFFLNEGYREEMEETEKQISVILPIHQLDARDIINGVSKVEVSGEWNQREMVFGYKLTLKDLNLSEKEVGFYQPGMKI